MNTTNAKPIASVDVHGAALAFTASAKAAAYACPHPPQGDTAIQESVMRKAMVVLALATAIAAPVVAAQDHDLPAMTPTVSAAAPAADHTGAGSTAATPGAKGRSGFGQVMRMLTDLLQEAARKQASATREEASPSAMSGDNSAVTIRVTPVAGRSSFHAPKAGRDKPAQTTATTMDTHAPSRRQAELAVQAGGIN